MYMMTHKQGEGLLELGDLLFSQGVGLELGQFQVLDPCGIDHY